MKKILTVIIIGLLCLSMFSILAPQTKAESVPSVEWERKYGGAGNQYDPSVIQTSDGGYLAVGNNNDGVWLLKVDHLGTPLWDRVYGGGGATDAVEDSDGNYVVVASAGGTWLFKVNPFSDPPGNIIWEWRYDLSAPTCLIRTTDNGFAVVGGFGFWLLKIDSNGIEQWRSVFGGYWASSVVQTSDGGYALAGERSEYGPAHSWLVKTNESGALQWDRTYGGAGHDNAGYVLQTDDGGYVLAGSSSSFGSGGSDAWLVRTDAFGNKLWDKTFGGSGEEGFASIKPTEDNGYILAGMTTSLGDGGYDVWLMKTDESGNEQWNNTYGGIADDLANSVLQTSDGGYILGVQTRSFSGDGSYDFWLIKLATEQPPQPDFEISVSPSFQTVNPGSPPVSYTISLTPLGESSSEVSLSREWVGTPPEDTVLQLSVTELIPPDTATLTVTTSPSTPLGQYVIRITGTSGSITHSKEITLIVGKVIEIEINPFRIKQDSDPYIPDVLPGGADPFFLIDVKDVDDDGDGLADDYGDDWFRSPKLGFEVNVGHDELNKPFVGPVYTPLELINSSVSLKVKAMDNDWPMGEEELSDTIFIFGAPVTTPPVKFEYDFDMISFTITIREIPPVPYTEDFVTNDEYNDLQWYWFDVDADKVRKTYEDNSFAETVVAVLDTGVDYSHADLAEVMWRDSDGTYGYDFVDSDTDPMDAGGFDEGGQLVYHGTAMAGIIAAKANNIQGIAGIASNVKIMAVRVVPRRGWAEADDVAKAIEYAVHKGAKVISMSFPVNPNANLESKISYAYKKGVVLVASSGNFRTSRPYYPAAYGKVISVSALSRVNVMADKLQLTSGPKNVSYNILDEYDANSNYGPDVSIPSRSIEFAAPGRLIWTTASSAEDLYYGYTTGTSPSAPIVSAVAALVQGYVQQKYLDRPLKPNEVRYILRESAVDLGPYGWDPYYGYGMVSAYKALQKVDELLGRKHWRIRLDPRGNLDLHVYDLDRHHVGIDYETGQEEAEIPEAHYTGDEVGGWETIFLPSDITEFEIKVVNRDPPDPIEFSLTIMSFDDLGNLVMEETRYGFAQANSEVAYTIEATETGEFSSYQFSMNVDKVFKPSQISLKRKGAVMSRTNVTNTGELNINELSYEDKILDGWTIPDFTRTISVTLFIGGSKYEIPYEELTYVAIENGKYIVQINFNTGIDLYQYDPTLGQEVYVTTIYAFEPGWIIEIKYPMHPPTNLLPGEYSSTVSITATSPEGITIKVEDTATLTVTN